MEYSFLGTEIPCPDCKPFGKDGKRRHLLYCCERNYSGTAQDHAECPECGHAFFISYKVDEITRCPDFDGQSREEREKDELQRIAKETINEISELERLAQKYKYNLNPKEKND